MTKLFALLLLVLPVFGQSARIVSTVPGLTEILFALGLGDQVVGVSEYCHYPLEAKKKPKVGTFLQPNLEVIASLRPTVVYIIKNPVSLRQKLEALGQKVEELDLERMPGILDAIAKIGARQGKQKVAAALRASIDARMKALAARAKTRQRAVFLVGRTPQRLEGMVAVGPGSYLGDLLRVAGGENVFEDAPTMYPKVSIEQLLARQPDVIFEMGDSVHEGLESKKYREDVLAVWAKLPALRAVTAKRVFPLNDDIFVVPGPRFAEAAERLAQMLEGGARR